MTPIEQAKKDVFWQKVRQGSLFALFVSVVNALFIATMTYLKEGVDWTLTAQAFGSGFLISSICVVILFSFAQPDYEVRHLPDNSSDTKEGDHE